MRVGVRGGREGNGTREEREIGLRVLADRKLPS